MILKTIGNIDLCPDTIVNARKDTIYNARIPFINIAGGKSMNTIMPGYHCVSQCPDTIMSRIEE